MTVTSAAGAPVNIDALDDVAGRAIVFGREIAVYNVDGETYRMLLAIDAGEKDPTTILKLYEACAKCCPDLSEHEVYRLKPKQLGALLGIAQSPIANVEAQFPNGAGPAAKTETLPA